MLTAGESNPKIRAIQKSAGSTRVNVLRNLRRENLLLFCINYLVSKCATLKIKIKFE
jgi:hypothetical protein